MPATTTPQRTRYTPPSNTFERPITELLVGDRMVTDPAKLARLMWRFNGVPSKTIYLAGNLELLSRPIIAIVGARQASDAGLKRAGKLARQMADSGIVVMSGLAAGVDRAAMTRAIDQGGHVIGVIGTPLDRAYPKDNARLQEEVYNNHLLISPFPVGHRPGRKAFPHRNKIMAALSDGTCVIEASDSSGTLHQSAECTRLNRWLFILRSLVENPDLKWPKDFLVYERAVTVSSHEDILDRLRTSL